MTIQRNVCVLIAAAACIGLLRGVAEHARKRVDTRTDEALARWGMNADDE